MNTIRSTVAAILGLAVGVLQAPAALAQEGDGLQEIECLPSDPLAPAEAYRGGHGTTEYLLVREFIDALNENKPLAIDAVKAAQWTAPGICAHESAMNEGQWVDVPHYTW